MKKRLLLLNLLFACILTGCKKESIEPTVTETVTASRVTNAVIEETTERVYENETTTTEDYGIVTESVVTEYAPTQTMPVETLEEPITVTFTEPENVSFTVQAVKNIMSDTSWSGDITKMRVAFCDLNLDGVPEMLITDMNKMISYASFDVFETKVYDLKTLECKAEIVDTARSAITCFNTAVEGPMWGYATEDGYYLFNSNCDVVKVIEIEIAEDETEKYYRDGKEITYDEYSSLIEQYFNYGDVNSDHTIVSLKQYITEENVSSFADYITEALAKWCIENGEPDATAIQ